MSKQQKNIAWLLILAALAWWGYQKYQSRRGG